MYEWNTVLWARVVRDRAKIQFGVTTTKQLKDTLGLAKKNNAEKALVLLPSPNAAATGSERSSLSLTELPDGSFPLPGTNYAFIDSGECGP